MAVVPALAIDRAGHVSRSSQEAGPASLEELNAEPEEIDDVNDEDQVYVNERLKAYHRPSLDPGTARHSPDINNRPPNRDCDDHDKLQKIACQSQ